MKIHIHTPSFFPALVGMTYATHVHASLLRALGADVTVIAPTSGPDGAAGSIDYQVRRFAVSGGGMPWNPLRGDVEGLLRFTQTERPDLVIAEGWFTVGAMVLPKLKPFCRHVVLSSHGSADLTLKSVRPAQLGRSLTYRWIEPYAQRQVLSVLSAAILLTSYRDRDRFRDGVVFERRGIPTYVCPNPSTYGTAADRRDGQRRHSLLHIGELTPHKNQLLAVQTLARLPEPFRLTLAYPRWMPYGDEVLKAAMALGVRDRVSLIEGRNRDELEPVFDAHDLLVITSRSEAQPIIAADALHKGMPFVSTPVGCMPEFGGGRVVAPAELHNAILDICGDGVIYSDYVRQAVAYYDSSLACEHSLAALRAMLSGLESR